jgi:hypothetical protein
MNEHEYSLWIIQNAINRMDEADKAKVLECAEKLTQIVREYGDCGRMALALVGATETAKEEAQ